MRKKSQIFEQPNYYIKLAKLKLNVIITDGISGVLHLMFVLNAGKCNLFS